MVLPVPGPPQRINDGSGPPPSTSFRTSRPSPTRCPWPTILLQRSAAASAPRAGRPRSRRAPPVPARRTGFRSSRVASWWAPTRPRCLTPILPAMTRWPHPHWLLRSGSVHDTPRLLLGTNFTRNSMMAIQRRVKLGLLAWAIASAAWGSSPSLAKDERTPLTIEDLYRIEGPQALRLAPDGRTAVFVRQWIDPETKRERNSLWMVDGDREKARPLEPGEPDARAPVFSPDGRWIAFVSTRPRPEGWRTTPPVPPESEPATDLWLIRADGGPSVPLAGPQPPHGRVFHDPFYAPGGILPRRSAPGLRRRRRPRPADPARAGRRRGDRPARPGGRLHRLRPRTGLGRPSRRGARRVRRLPDRSAHGRRRLVRRPAMVARRADRRRPRQQDGRPRVGPLQHQQGLRPLGDRRRDPGSSGRSPRGPGPTSRPGSPRTGRGSPS